MRKTLTTIGALLVGMGAFPAVGEPVSNPTSTERITVAEMNEVVDQTNFIVNRGCSGTLINREHRLVLTNFHCVNGLIKFMDKETVKNGVVRKTKVEVRSTVTVEQKYYTATENTGSTSFQAEILAYNKDTDLALLQIKSKIPQTKEAPVLPKGEEVMRGDSVWVVGNPAGFDATVTTGVISSMTREFDRGNGIKVSTIQTDAGMFFGNSGGAMLDQYGRLIGVPALLMPGTSMGWAIHYTHIWAFLSENCWGRLYDSEADDEACEKKKEPKEDESMEDLLQKLISQKDAPSPASE